MLIPVSTEKNILTFFINLFITNSKKLENYNKNAKKVKFAYINFLAY
jgi:hypothetical protein